MTPQFPSMPSSYFQVCRPSSGGFFFLCRSTDGPLQLEAHLKRYPLFQRAQKLDNGRTVEEELLRNVASDAAHYGNKKLITYIREKWGSYIFNMGDKNKNPPLSDAISNIYRSRSLEAAKELIKSGCHVNVLMNRNPLGKRMTLLEQAIHVSHSSPTKELSFVILLLKNGACLEEPTNLKPEELNCLILAQKEIAKDTQRAFEVQTVLEYTFARVLIEMINAYATSI